MARQRVHNRRAGRGSSGGGASWISYSDMMASLLLVFVLILCVSLYEYFMMLDAKTRELDNQAVLLEQQQTELNEANRVLGIQQNQLATQSATLLAQQATLDDQSAQLAAQQVMLDSQSATLATQRQELDAAYAALAAKEQELLAMEERLANQQMALDASIALLNSQQAKLDEQTAKIDALVGVRAEMIAELSRALSAAHLTATVDPNSGAIVLDSAVFFESGSAVIKPEGKAMLDRFMPVYLGVLMQPQYSEYLGEIIIEGHTDTTGDYFMNLELSQNRALAVVKYCLEMDTLTPEQKALLPKIITATGRSYSDPVYNSDGTVNMAASRRVEFKFTLRDAEMINEMNRLLQGQ